MMHGPEIASNHATPVLYFLQAHSVKEDPGNPLLHYQAMCRGTCHSTHQHSLHQVVAPFTSCCPAYIAVTTLHL